MDDLLILIIAQHFQIADRIVVLGDNGIKEQGTWQEIKARAATIAKFTIGTQEKNDAILSADMNKLNAQVQARNEAEADLSRQTGDISLYCIAPTNLRSDFSLLIPTQPTIFVILKK